MVDVTDIFQAQLTDDSTPNCPHHCLRGSNWVFFIKGDRNYVKPCPVHRPNYVPPDDRPDPMKEKERAESKKRTREALSVLKSEDERTDW